MNDIVVDSSVVAKWVMPEPDSAQVQQLITNAATAGDRLIVLDLAFVEVCNAIWKSHRKGQISADKARTRHAEELAGSRRNCRATAGRRNRNRHAIRPCSV